MTQPAPKMDRDKFLENLRASGLIDASELDAALRSLPESDRGRVVARELVAKGLLTRFQAELLMAGRTHGFFLGQYRILEEVGRGGMGRVFLAEHQTMGRRVALKILSPGLTKTDKARVLFQREVKAAAKLTHPNIVTAYDANQVDDRCYLVMEYVDGPNLSDFVKKNGPLPVSQAGDFIRQAALGLQYAHDLGMVHRDIKPANLLVQRNSGKPASAAHTVKILDFGLARLSAQDEGVEGGKETIITNKQSVMGTPDYLAPEQARSIHAVDNRSDIYSLGCTFYYLVTGKVPFPGGTAFEKLVKHTTEVPRPARAVNPNVTPVVSEIIERMLEKDPDDRFQSGTELATVLALLDLQERGGWIDVEPPVKGDRALVGGSTLLPITELPSLPAERSDVADLWASLESDAPGSDATLTGDQSKTSVSKTSVPLPPKAGKSHNAIIVAIVAVVLVITGVLIRALVHKAGRG